MEVAKFTGYSPTVGSYSSPDTLQGEIEITPLSNEFTRPSPLSNEYTLSSPLSSEYIQTSPRSPHQFLDHHSRPWEFVDVPGSPKLSRLFTALDVDNLSDVESLSLPESSITEVVNRTTRPNSGYSDNLVHYSNSSRHSVRQNSYDQNITVSSPATSRRQSPSLIFELYPFPQFLEPGWNTSVSSIFVLPTIELSVPELQLRVANDNMALAALEAQLTDDHPEVIELMRTLATYYHSLGEFVQAGKLWRRIAEARERMDGADSLSTMHAWAQVIKALDDQGDQFDEASKLHKYLYRQVTEKFSAEHELALELISQQSVRLRNKSYSTEAEAIQRQLLQLTLSSLGPRHETTLRAMSMLARNMATIYFYLPEGSKSEKERHFIQLARTAVNLLDKTGVTLGLGSSLELVNNLLCALRFGEQYKEASDLGEIVVQNVAAAFGESHPRTLKFMAEVGAAYERQGRFLESVNLLITVLKNQRGDIHHLDAIHRVQVLCEGLLGLERWDEAIFWAERALLLISANYEPMHEWIKEGRIYIGDIYLKQHRYVDACMLYREYIEIIRKDEQGGDNHPWIEELYGIINDIEKLARP